MSIKTDFITAVERDGFYLMENVLDSDFLKRAKDELESAINKETEYHHDALHRDYGMVLLCCLYGGVFFEIFENQKLIEPFHWLMGEGCIVYSQTSTSMPPLSGNYSSRIHVDSARCIPGYISSFMSLILLDDFTEENGATWFLPCSHNSLSQPSGGVFYAKAKRLIARAGSVLFWNPRVWHAGGSNKTEYWRHALTIVMCRPYMKQRIDIPRALATHDLSNISDFVKQKLGFMAQVPASYDEYYAPPEKRKFRQKTE
jgi:ectoine hydroxylase-related dioxygenase (phytanoyl-CoA dioxygenase family)